MSCNCSIFFNNVFFFSITEWNQIIFHIYVCKYLFPICLTPFLKMVNCASVIIWSEDFKTKLDHGQNHVWCTWISNISPTSSHKENEKWNKKTKRLQHWTVSDNFGFYTWLTKGSVDGSPWLVESVDLDFSETPVEVEMTPWVS